MTSAAKSGFGTQFKYGSSSPASTALGEVLSISGPDEKVGVIKVTNMSSPTNAAGAGIEEKIAAILDNGKVTVQVNLLKAEVTATEALVGKNGEFWQIAFSQGSLLDFQGILVGRKFGAEKDKQLTVDLEIEISGAVTWTA